MTGHLHCTIAHNFWCCSPSIQNNNLFGNWQTGELLKQPRPYVGNAGNKILEKHTINNNHDIIRYLPSVGRWQRNRCYLLRNSGINGRLILHPRKKVFQKIWKTCFLLQLNPAKTSPRIAVIMFLKTYLFDRRVRKMLENQSARLGLIVAERKQRSNIMHDSIRSIAAKPGWFMSLPAVSRLIAPGSQPFLTTQLAVTVSAANNQVRPNKEMAPIIGRTPLRFFFK